MNTKITALKKKIELKEKQLKAKEALAAKNKEAVKEIKGEIELLTNELAKEEMLEMMELMGEKNLDIEDVKAAIVAGAIVGKPVKDTEKTETEADDISKKIKEINEDKEEKNNAEQGKND